MLDLAHEVDAFLAESTYPDRVPDDSRSYLNSARQAGAYAARVGAARLLLTHLWPGTDPGSAREAAMASFDGDVAVATPGLVIDLDVR